MIVSVQEFLYGVISQCFMATTVIDPLTKTSFHWEGNAVYDADTENKLVGEMVFCCVCMPNNAFLKCLKIDNNVILHKGLC